MAHLLAASHKQPPSWPVSPSALSQTPSQRSMTRDETSQDETGQDTVRTPASLTHSPTPSVTHSVQYTHPPLADGSQDAAVRRCSHP
ncbi:hypothetical protein BKA81DRAFT_355675 [Phyllosticta paracitricarpa]